MSSEFYLQIFVESAHSASIIPLSSQTAYFAMHAFGTYPMAVPFALAVAGATLGQAFNWWLGNAIYKLWLKRKTHPNEAQHAKAARFFNRYGIWALLLSWMPLVNIITVAAGFLGVRFKTAIALLFVGIAAYYAWPLL